MVDEARRRGDQPSGLQHQALKITKIQDPSTNSIHSFGFDDSFKTMESPPPPSARAD